MYVRNIIFTITIYQLRQLKILFHDIIDIYIFECCFYKKQKNQSLSPRFFLKIDSNRCDFESWESLE